MIESIMIMKVRYSISTSSAQRRADSAIMRVDRAASRVREYDQRTAQGHDPRSRLAAGLVITFSCRV